MSERTHACRSYKMITSTGIHKVTRVVRTHVTRVTSGSDQLPTWAPQGLNQIYSVQVFSSAGTYTLSFGGQTTSSLPYNATPGAVQAALAALSSVGNANDVRVTQPHPESGQLLVEFLGSLGWSSFGPTGLTVTGSSLADPVAIQRVTLAGADGGTFRLSFNGSTTSALAAGATASAVQTRGPRGARPRPWGSGTGTGPWWPSGWSPRPRRGRNPRGPTTTSGPGP
jgi:hypothetical protein